MCGRIWWRTPRGCGNTRWSHRVPLSAESSSTFHHQCVVPPPNTQKPKPQSLLSLFWTFSGLFSLFSTQIFLYNWVRELPDKRSNLQNRGSVGGWRLTTPVSRFRCSLFSLPVPLKKVCHGCFAGHHLRQISAGWPRKPASVFHTCRRSARSDTSICTAPCNLTGFKYLFVQRLVPWTWDLLPACLVKSTEPHAEKRSPSLDKGGIIKRPPRPQVSSAVSQQLFTSNWPVFCTTQATGVKQKQKIQDIEYRAD